MHQARLSAVTSKLRDLDLKVRSSEAEKASKDIETNPQPIPEGLIEKLNNPKGLTPITLLQSQNFPTKEAFDLHPPQVDHQSARKVIPTRQEEGIPIAMEAIDLDTKKSERERGTSQPSSGIIDFIGTGGKVTVPMIGSNPTTSYPDQTEGRTLPRNRTAERRRQLMEEDKERTRAIMAASTIYDSSSAEYVPSPAIPHPALIEHTKSHEISIGTPEKISSASQGITAPEDLQESTKEMNTQPSVDNDFENTVKEMAKLNIMQREKNRPVDQGSVQGQAIMKLITPMPTVQGDKQKGPKIPTAKIPQVTQNPDRPIGYTVLDEKIITLSDGRKMLVNTHIFNTTNALVEMYNELIHHHPELTSWGPLIVKDLTFYDVKDYDYEARMKIYKSVLRQIYITLPFISRVEMRKIVTKYEIVYDVTTGLLSIFDLEDRLKDHFDREQTNLPDDTSFTDKQLRETRHYTDTSNSDLQANSKSITEEVDHQKQLQEDNGRLFEVTKKSEGVTDNSSIQKRGHGKVTGEFIPFYDEDTDDTFQHGLIEDIDSQKQDKTNIEDLPPVTAGVKFKMVKTPKHTDNQNLINLDETIAYPINESYIDREPKWDDDSETDEGREQIQRDAIQPIKFYNDGNEILPTPVPPPRSKNIGNASSGPPNYNKEEMTPIPLGLLSDINHVKEYGSTLIKGISPMDSTYNYEVIAENLYRNMTKKLDIFLSHLGYYRTGKDTTYTIINDLLGAVSSSLSVLGASNLFLRTEANLELMKILEKRLMVSVETITTKISEHSEEMNKLPARLVNIYQTLEKESPTTLSNDTPTTDHSEFYRIDYLERMFKEDWIANLYSQELKIDMTTFFKVICRAVNQDEGYIEKFITSKNPSLYKAILNTRTGVKGVNQAYENVIEAMNASHIEESKKQ
ncbi:hypothetical protein 2 [Hubei myriapoda virus 7]|uniref:hypothetical protein 2 n=1 Tax=Hubei myriapoda virus 7 TaxID=1922936 RepID=UPI0009099F99|nr:hypothetical protein 2 [Hubei myriapoda virus 7]APG78791.1 hypothetical protein 2 [Hubei myriapoda virus 7]